MFPFGGLDEVGKQNMALFESTLKAFSPFATPAEPEAEENNQAEPAAAADPDSLRELKEQVDLLQRQLESLSARGGRGGKKESG
jgi:polyhydroxyalkanoate synthesis regulator protein